MQQGITFDILREIDPQALFPVQASRNMYYVVKRLLDFSIAFLALLLLSPLMLLVAILIKLDSPGPVLFKQERVSVRRRTRSQLTYWQKVTFRCYKFRTMVYNADPSLHKAYIKALIDNDLEGMSILQGGDTKVRKLINDPRVTQLGRDFRKAVL
jgi:lipopolysaccharide/colanic/teichoic acid biosynthesis glycosyltransferase